MSTYSAFVGHRRVASGPIETVVLRGREDQTNNPAEPLLVFDDETGRQIDFDLRGTEEEVLAKLASHPLVGPAVRGPKPGPGRPRLGVVSREVSLLPGHWNWLEEQPQGASATLRRLVVEAMRSQPAAQRARMIREATGRLMWALAGNLPGFEEASRALFACDLRRFEDEIALWPADVRDHLTRLARRSAEVEGA